MQNEIFEKMTEAGKTSYSAMQELGEINTKILKELSELQMSMASYSLLKLNLPANTVAK